MTKYIYNNLKTKFISLKTGIAAVEFALIAPLLISLFLGTVELSFMMLSQRRLTAANATMSDLVSRYENITNNDMREIFGAASLIANSTTTKNLHMRITVLERVPTNTRSGKVLWSSAATDAYPLPLLDSTVLPKRDVGETLLLPNGARLTAGTLILAETKCTYRSFIGFFPGTTDKPMADTFLQVPRSINGVSRSAT